MDKLDSDRFTNDNYTPYGNIVTKISQGDFSNILGYTYETSYFTKKGYGGVMFTNKFNKEVWTECPLRLIQLLAL